MKNYAFVLITVWFTVSCTKVDFRRNVESFSSASFHQIDLRASGSDLLLADDGSLVIAGIGDNGTSILLKPCILEVDLQHENTWASFLPASLNYVVGEMSLYATLEKDYLLLLNSDDSSQEDGNSIDLTKMNQNGNITWDKRIQDGSKEFISSSLVQLPEGGFIVFSEDQQSLGGENQLNLSKISADGELIWSRLVPESRVSLSRQLLYFPENEYFIGLSEQNVTFQQGKVQLYKFDTEGNVIWERTIVEFSDIWGGSSYLAKVDVDQLLITYTENTDLKLLKLDAEGNEIWEKTFSGNKSDVSVGVIQTQDGQYVLLSNTTSFGNGEFDVMLTKIDQDGELVWEKVYGGSSSDQSVKVAERDNGDLVVIGNSNEHSGSSSQYELFIFETDSEGNPR